MTPLDAARADLGYVEGGGPHGNDGNITKFWEWWDSITGEHDEGASWCGCFVSWCFDHAGARFSIAGKPGFIYCPTGEAWFRSQGALTDVAQAQPGDVVFYDFQERDAQGRLIPPPHHTGILESVDVVHRTVTVIEGNTTSGTAGSQSNGGGVYRRTRPWSQVRSVGHVTWIHPPEEELVQITPVTVKVDHTSGKGWAVVAGVHPDVVWGLTPVTFQGSSPKCSINDTAALDGDAVVTVDLGTPTQIDVDVVVRVAHR